MKQKNNDVLSSFIKETLNQHLHDRSLLKESAKGPLDLPDNMSVMIITRETGGTATFYDTTTGKKRLEWVDNRFGGAIMWSKTWEGPNVVTLVNDTTPGFGPMLYDIAMEMAGSRGLMSDRRTVSTDAKIVWNYYDTKRPDVQKKQMDNLENQLTADPRDNILQTSAERDTGEYGWSKSSLSRVYFSTGTPVLDALKSAGKLIVV